MKRYVTLYLQFARAKNYRNGGNMILVSSTTSPPTRRPSGTIVVKLRVEVPDKAFDPASIPSLLADIQLESIVPAPADMDVTIEDPQED